MSMFSSPNLLRTALWADAMVSLASGALQVAFSGPMSEWLGLIHGIGEGAVVGNPGTRAERSDLGIRAVAAPGATRSARVTPSSTAK